MNYSDATSHLRQHDGQGLVELSPNSITSRKGDGLTMISIIVAAFVFLAILIIVMVHYGPQLRTIQMTLYHEPLPQDMDSQVRLTNWKKLSSQNNEDKQFSLSVENNNATDLEVSYEHRKPNIIEITSL